MHPREFFESAREASADAERCRRQLMRLEASALSLGGGGQGPRVRSTPDPRRMEARAVRHADMEERLEARMEADYALIDRACAVLYGDGRRSGLDMLLSPVAADVLWWRYLDGATWERVARAVGPSPRACQQERSRALAWMRRNGFRQDLMAEGPDGIWTDGTWTDGRSER